MRDAAVLPQHARVREALAACNALSTCLVEILALLAILIDERPEPLEVLQFVRAGQRQDT